MSIIEKLDLSTISETQLLKRGVLTELKDDIFGILENPNEIPLIYRTGPSGEAFMKTIRPKEPKASSVTINNFKLGVDYAIQNNFGAQYHFRVFDSSPCSSNDGSCFLNIWLSHLKHSFSLNFDYNGYDGGYTPFTMEEYHDKDLFENMRKFLGPL
jgi:hypothetical protein